MNLLFGSLAVVFAGMTIGALFNLQWAKRVPAFANSAGGSGSTIGSVRCSVIIAARNEEDRIGKTIEHLLAQREVNVEVIAVDDRSTDRTGEVMRELAAKDRRVRYRRVETLPEGWLGKCHACHLGAMEATGDWILFTDADCWMKPDLIARALQVAARENVDHITMTPGVAPETIAGRAWHLAFLVGVADWFARVNRDRPKGYLGMGAFNLLRSQTYRGCGGHEALRLTVVDDVKLGLLVRRAGKRTRAFIGGDDVETHWGLTARSMVKIMEKNYFAAIEYRTVLAFGLGIFGPIVWVIAAAGVFTGTLAGAAATLAWLSLILPAAVLAKRLGWSLSDAAFTPFIYPMLFYAVLNSTIVTLRQGGIRWRDTFYSLDTLRANNVR
jgi:glycosyltransferase involved in cell wall biosynthesis